MKPPEAEQNWRRAKARFRGLIDTADGRDFIMHASTGMLRALNRHVELVFNPDRTETPRESGSWHGIDNEAPRAPKENGLGTGWRRKPQRLPLLTSAVGRPTDGSNLITAPHAASLSTTSKGIFIVGL